MCPGSGFAGLALSVGLSVAWSLGERVRYAALLRVAELADYRELVWAGRRDAFEASVSFDSACELVRERKRLDARAEVRRMKRERALMDAAFRALVVRGGEVLPWREVQPELERVLAVQRAGRKARAAGGARDRSDRSVRFGPELFAFVLSQVMRGPMVYRRPGREPVVFNRYPEFCESRGVYGPRVAELAAAARADDAARRRRLVRKER